MLNAESFSLYPGRERTSLFTEEGGMYKLTITDVGAIGRVEAPRPI